MFAHAELKPVWPVIFLLPWFLFGIANVCAAILQRRSKVAMTPRAVHTRLHRQLGRFVGSLMILGMTCLAATHVALADPATGVSRSCEAASPQDAKSLADVLYERGEYQHAGVCYDVAGDALRAQRAFLRAVGPNTESAARGIKEESDTAKALFSRAQQAFRSNR
jgi:hypothetical protein